MSELSRKIYRYWCIHGTTKLIKRIFSKLKDKIFIAANKTNQLIGHPKKTLIRSQLIYTRFPSIIPLRTYMVPNLNKNRVNLVTDSVISSSLFGGVGTSLIFSALLANKLNVPLRVVTRNETPIPENIARILTLYRISLKHDIQFKFAPFYDEKYELDIVSNDLFITTSWWTTAATLPSVQNDKIIYLLQEDERMFYPFGDDRLKCETILRNSNILFLINTKLLFDHFLNDNFSNFLTKGLWFEPAFPSHIYHQREKPISSSLRRKHKFFFYARPNHARNLFYLGIEVLEQAIAEGVLDTECWDIFFVGTDLPEIAFTNGYKPIKCQNLSWSEYAEFAGTIDLGLSLMYTPHPSYPPLDLIASGAVVVTNKFANKVDLSSRYSKNLICADLNSQALVEALRRGVALATDHTVRGQNYRSQDLVLNWQQAFNEIIEQIHGGQ